MNEHLCGSYPAPTKSTASTCTSLTDCVVMPGGLGAGPKKMTVKAGVPANVVIKPAPAVVRVQKAQAAPIDEIDEIADEIHCRRSKLLIVRRYYTMGC